jgi:capsular exopolysaccharide synthesis family protein
METPGTALTPLGPDPQRGPFPFPAPRPAAAYPRQPAAPPSSHAFDAPTGGLLEYWRIIQRRKGAVIVITCLGALAGLLYTLPQTPVYRATTLIELQEMNEDFMHMRDVNPNAPQGGGGAGDEIQTQVRILQSVSLRDRVVKKLALEAKTVAPKKTRLDAWREALKIAPAQPPTPESIVANAARGVLVRAQANTRLIVISCDSTNPQMAADFLNTLTNEYKLQNVESRWKATQYTGDWLTGQMEDLKIKLEHSEDALQSYAAHSGLLITGEKDNVADDRVKQFQEALSKAQGERIDAQSKSENASHAPADSVPEVLDDASTMNIRGKVMDLRGQLADLGGTYTSAYPRVREIEDQIAAYEDELAKERKTVISRIQNDYATAQQREKLLADQYNAAVLVVAQQADQVAHYNILKREVDTDRTMYDGMLQRVKESSIAAALRASNIDVVDPAVAPEEPYKPSAIDNTGLGFLFGLAFAVSFVVLLDRADRTIQDPSDIEALLGIPELGLVPSAAADPGRPRGLASGAADGQDGTRSMVLLTAERKNSALAESIHATLTSILYAGPAGQFPQVLVFSSPAPSEGKTTISSSLAVALAHIHKRVLLVDADLRRPRLHQIFDVDNDKGMVDLLRRTEPIQGSLDGHVRATAIPNLSVMPAGHSGAGDPTLLHSARLGEIVRTCRGLYDVVIVDTPPMMTMADARVIARHADGVVLVVRATRTSRDSLRDAYRRFSEDGSRVLGAILNDWNPKKSGRYGYYRYYSKYKHYYSPGDGGKGSDAK